MSCIELKYTSSEGSHTLVMPLGYYLTNQRYFDNLVRQMNDDARMIHPYIQESFELS